ncbi:lipoprotein LprE [Mycobacterium tuberculosis]|nr:lipoprotein LprE [Mycobacterium tuberculosis]
MALTYASGIGLNNVVKFRWNGGSRHQFVVNCDGRSPA